MIDICIEPAQFRLNASGLVHGPLRISADGFSFPSKNWSDFVAVVLGWWSDGAAKLFRGGSVSSVTLEFMDGPFEIAVVAGEQPGRVRLCLTNSGREQRVVREVETELLVFVQKVLDVGIEVVALCHDRGWETDGVKQLNLSVDKLAVALKRATN